MKSIRIHLVAFLTLILFCCSASATTLYLAKVDGAMGTLGPITALPGEAITIAAYVTDVPADPGFGGFQLFLEKTGPATFTGPSRYGEWFLQGNIWPDWPMPNPGPDYVYGMLISGSLSGSGCLTEFTVRVDAVGPVTIDFADKGMETFLANRLAYIMEVNYGDPLVINVVPEPATLTLVGFGLAGLIGIRRRRS